MAERIVSPGVFTRERDLSFLPQGVANIDAVIVGPTLKGPSFVPTQVTSMTEFESVFGSFSSDIYTPYTVNEYLRSAGSVKVVRVGYLGGYKVSGFNLVVSASKAGTSGSSNVHMVVATFLPAINNVGGSISGSLSTSTGMANHPMVSGSKQLGIRGILSGSAEASASNFNLTIAGANATASLSNLTIMESGTGTTSNFFADKIPHKATAKKIGTTDAPAYIYKHFRSNISASQDLITPSASLKIENFVVASGYDFTSGAETVTESNNSIDIAITGNSDATNARTPYIQDQNGTNLFKIYMRADGTHTNDYFVVIRDVKKPTNSNSSPEFAQFGLALYDLDSNLIERFDNLNMDPESPNFIAKVIGDQFQKVDNEGNVTMYGNYPNLARHIRIGDYDEEAFKSSKTSQPMGFAAVLDPIKSTAPVPSASFSIQQIDYKSGDTNTYVEDAPYGYKIDGRYHLESSLDTNKAFLSPIPKSETAGNNIAFSLLNMKGFGSDTTSPSLTTLQEQNTNFAGATVNISISSSIAQMKFAVPFQHGFDGIDPARALNTGNSISSTNSMGFDCSTTTSSGSVAYKRAINAVSNPDEIDINMVVTPGMVHSLHSPVTNHVINKVESRADAFYVMDGSGYSANVNTAVNDVVTLDTNYVASYYPWVKIDDPGRAGNMVWVPPSVVIPGVIAFTDRVAHEWFAPAGLNRGGLSSVRMAKKKLTHTDRDTLYDGRINPIATFPGQGVVVFGQKTLQAKPSALDRINVRRLLIRLKKFIASSSRFLVFEQNDSSTRSRFLNIVNPFLESVQANSGLSAFKVVMDDSNNTPDVIDRNQLVGQIFIQPTRTAEFIVLDFTVLPTGAAFPE